MSVSFWCVVGFPFRRERRVGAGRAFAAFDVVDAARERRTLDLSQDRCRKNENS
jgi:hypothetical protein